MGLFSNILGRSKRSETQADTPEPSLKEQLIEAEAHLAKTKALPLSAFAEKSHKAVRYSAQFGPITYSVDNKDDAIDRAKAEVIDLRTKIRLSQRCADKPKSQAGGIS